jgi:RNA polymerase sigma factor (sigma-70 family)
LDNCAQQITAHWPLINRLAGRRFGDTVLAEEGALYVLERLEEDDCRRLQSFGGRSKFSTFVGAVAVRLLEDFARARFGRVRPPSWITGLGGVWLLLFELLCLQRLNAADAVETVLTRRPSLARESVDRKAWTILEQVVDCGRHQGREISLPENDHHDTPADRKPSPEEQLLADERQTFFTLLFADAAVPVVDNASLEKFRETVRLSGEDRLLLKLCFQEELSVTRAGELLGLGPNQVHGRLRRLLTRIRTGLEQAGISEELRDMLHG